jgi:vitamin-K-epoxide reductase (warfarin-sensitive)
MALTAIEQSNLIFYVLPIIAAQTIYIYCLGFHESLRVRQLSIAMLGIYWCLAGLRVEILLESTFPHFDYHNPPADMSKYTPFCDFAEWAKCSKVLMSPYGRFLQYIGLAAKDSMLDLPNPIMGSGYFLCHVSYPILKAIKFPLLNELATGISLFVCFFSVWLGHKLFFVLQDFCIVCVSSYLCNFLLFFTMVQIWKKDRAEATKKGK